MILNIFLAAAATIGFSIIFNIPRKELIFCGLAGAGCWSVLTLIITLSPDSRMAATFVAAVVVTIYARILSTLRKMPSTVYMIPGIIPLVPGTRIYNTMLYIVTGEHAQALSQGIEALAISGVISIGLLAALSLPRWLFSFERNKTK
ncbi:MAG: threonine/serine exporter family protein [Clostridiales bacterium]|jgi:uncharacterized membrane protein YjjB (DUF3815 family)|nr:threonine/serine exporter family protein [Clostridiales bacterium]